MNNLITPARRALLLAGALTLAAACNVTNPSPTPAPVQSPTPAAIESASPAATAAIPPSGTASAVPAAGAECDLSDLGLAGGGWSAAAGSRGADVSVENRGAAACVLPAGPSVAIVDSAGRVLLESEPGSGGPGATLEPGAVATFTVLFSNWCEEGTSLPLQVLLRAGGAGSPVPGLELTADDLPPCNGPAQPATLSANPWQPIGS